MGHASRDFGAELEQRVRRKLESLQPFIVGRFQKNEVRFALIANAPKRRQCARCGHSEEKFEPMYKRVESSGADFSGHLGKRTTRPGLAFGIEVKSVGPKPPREGPGMQTFIREARMPDEQIAHLDALDRDGAIALLLLEWRLPDAPWFISIIPWRDVPWEIKKVRRHLGHEAARRWATGPGSRLEDHFFLDGDASSRAKSS